MVSTVAPSLGDPKRRVRQAALELMAVIAANVPGNATNMIYDEVSRCYSWFCRNYNLFLSKVDKIELSSYDDPKMVAAAVQGRLSRKQLPR